VVKGWWRWIQWIGGALVIAFVVTYLARNWDAVRAAHIEWAFRPGLIVASLALVLATYAILIQSWRTLLAGWGPRLGWWQSARIWVLSSMGKYLPGKVWAVAGMAMLSQRQGVPPWAATASAVLLQAVAIATGAALVGVTGIAALEAARPGSQEALVVVLVVSIAGLAALVWPPVARRIMARVAPGSGPHVTPPASALLFGIGANALAWVGYGIALWLLARGVLPHAELQLPDALGAFAGSYLAGLLFLLAPGGIGVRESVFVLMLQHRIGLANALALAAVSRLGMTVADVLAALPFLLTRQERARESR
jgi:uncharacterized membrane protein YbhN (UPF0104 family)